MRLLFAPIRTNSHRRPVKEHTELEEELHEKAHIDYDRVAIVRRLLLQIIYHTTH